MGDVAENIELIQHRNPGTRSDWRLRLHHGARQIDEESPRISAEDFRVLRQAPFYSAFDQLVRQTDWADFWDWLSQEARNEVFDLVVGG